MNIQSFGKSERGIHLQNQDSFLLAPEKGLFAVADGVTISRGDSKQASTAAVKLLEEEFEGNLEQTFLEINKEISELEGAGTTTLTAARIKGQALEVAHVGDSSLFLVREGIRKVTEDDSTHGSNVLKQVIGKGNPKPHLYKLPLKSGDIILLATDGAAKHLDENDILKALKGPLENVPAELIKQAYKKRKLYEDDKTIVMVKV
ncbi:MAG: protein phosphatase 2C domain-containing protein [Candidatus Aenigmarchaeota archaeon]|nr:protein phosphatase 2C domain-containing protein [Candidatus Aenigmarchaeota archaeon]